MLNNFFFENRAVYEKMYKNVVERGRPQVTIWRMRIACWITKATKTLSEYVIFNAFSATKVVTRKRRAVYGKLLKNIVERGRPQMTMWRMRIACWITKATNILIRIQRQMWLRERASMFHYSTLSALLLKSIISLITLTVFSM